MRRKNEKNERKPWMNLNFFYLYFCAEQMEFTVDLGVLYNILFTATWMSFTFFDLTPRFKLCTADPGSFTFFLAKPSGNFGARPLVEERARRKNLVAMLTDIDRYDEANKWRLLKREPINKRIQPYLFFLLFSWRRPTEIDKVSPKPFVSNIVRRTTHPLQKEEQGGKKKKA